MFAHDYSFIVLPSLISRAAFCVGFRVKAPLTRRPPHRSVREAFPHTVVQALFTELSTNQATPRLAHNFAALQVFKYYGLFGGAAGGTS